MVSTLVGIGVLIKGFVTLRDGDVDPFPWEHLLYFPTLAFIQFLLIGYLVYFVFWLMIRTASGSRQNEGEPVDEARPSFTTELNVDGTSDSND